MKITPGSSATKILGVYGDQWLKVSISAAPEKGKANKELIRFLSKAIQVPSKNLMIVSGETSPMKIIEIDCANNLDKLNELLNRMTTLKLS
ncbi:MAG: DUF167 domain-containing protein [Halobacteriovoraceae bacterium]|nr:DUF167 domain-containing protein [Halobacteriovoraceae bacterium]MCB9093801.1 DUF167 domain-containing protein [Halobacteriovoraceae bacterium]